MGYYKIEQASNGQYYFNLKDGNNKTILTSETYPTQQVATDGIDAVKRNSGNESNYRKFIGNDNQYYFSLRAGNYEKIAKSEGYTTSSGRDAGVKNCMVEGPNSPTR